MPEFLTWPLTWYLFGMVAFAFVGAVIGRAKDAELAGFVLGLLLGPLGVILTFACDFRPPDERDA